MDDSTTTNLLREIEIAEQIGQQLDGAPAELDETVRTELITVAVQEALTLSEDN